MDVRRLGTALAACLALTVPLLGAPTPAAAQDGSVAGSTAPIPAEPDYLPPTPDDFSVSAAEAVEIANADPKVAEQSARYGELTTAISVNDDNLWQVGYKDGDNEVAQVKIDGGTGAITESWTGYQVAWPMARGYEAQFGHILNAPWVWIPMALVFLAGLFDFRRPGRIAHLDLLVLLSFGISQAFFNGGEIGVSVPLVYPALVYLLARVLWIGFRGGGGLRPSLPVRWLGLAAILLIAFRITINIADSGVIDVGYAGTIGADRITHADPLWGEGVFPDDNRFGDTYGPANYYAYVPFELAFPWSGEWDELVSSHAAALAFDLATIAGLFFCATRLVGGRAGRDLGVLCAFAWVAYPYTAFALQSNSNDTLVAALVVWSLALFARPLARGALLAAATMVKFAPLALVPLYAAGFRGLLGGDGEGRRLAPLRPVVMFSLGFVVAAALLLVYPALDSGLGTFFDRTVVSQLDRTSPFSIWGQVDGIQWLQTATLAATAVLAALLAFVPRRRDLPRVAALTAAVLIALQLSVDHWFYLYIPWFFGALMIALLCLPASERVSGAG
ncbi:MAG: glycosyltransferase 87 family protein [Solirubrobacterales bacterium]